MIFESIVQPALENTNFRHVIFTGLHSQLVLMSLLPREEIGEETHKTSDQILIIVEGNGEAVINGIATEIQKDSLVYVPANTKHNIINKGEEEMKLYTVYAPSVHADGIIHATKADAAKEEKD